jgi:hypothetical protein
MQLLRFREDLNTPDAEFFIRLAQEGARFIFVPDYLMEFRIHQGAVTAGGHWNEQLVECLTSVAVKPEVEPYKRQFLTPMVVNAVSRCLQQGNMERARAFLQNEYYPRRRNARRGASGRQTGRSSDLAPEMRNGNDHALRYALGSLLQGFCASLPASVGAPIYRAVRRIRLAGVSKRS